MESQFNGNEFAEIFDGYKAPVNENTPQTEQKLKTIAGTPEARCEIRGEEKQEFASDNGEKYILETAQFDETINSAPVITSTTIHSPIRVPIKLA